MCDYENPWRYNGKDFDGTDIGDYYDSSIALLIENREKSILVESISTANEKLEVKYEGLQLKVTGRNTTAAVMNLIKSARRWGTFPTSESY